MSEEGLLYDEKRDLRGGTLEKLLHRIHSGRNGEWISLAFALADLFSVTTEYSEIFVIVYRAFTTAQTVMSYMIEEYKKDAPNGDFAHDTQLANKRLRCESFCNFYV